MTAETQQWLAPAVVAMTATFMVWRLWRGRHPHKRACGKSCGCRKSPARE